jgi:hypothetical protein
MGGTASTLNGNDAGAVSKQMQEKLVEYQAKNLPEEEFAKKLSEDYVMIVGSVKLSKKETKEAKNSDENTASGRLVLDSNNLSQKSSKIQSKTPNSKREGLSGKFGGKSTKGNKDTKTPTRRRSFDQQANNTNSNNNNPNSFLNKKLFDNMNPSEKMSASESAPTISMDKLDQLNNNTKSNTPPPPKSTTTATTAPVEAIADSWDSANQQPYCKICAMAFRSDLALDKHIKFSDFHKNNELRKRQQQEQEEKEKREKQENDLATNLTTSQEITMPALLDKSDPLTLKQIEGEHFTALYIGSKLFWRTQETIDFHFYHHILPHCIEIVGYDSVKTKELNRIYLDYFTIYEIMLETKREFPNEIEQLKQDEEYQRASIATYILQRLQLQSNNTISLAGDTHSTNNNSSNNNTSDTVATLKALTATTDAMLASTSTTTTTSAVTAANSPSAPHAANPSNGAGNMLVFTRLAGDTYTRSPVIDKPPIVLIPVVIHRRRRTSSQEIDDTITSLTNDRAALKSLTNQAEKIASLVYSSANTLLAKKWYTHFSHYRKKWILAIRRIIRQKCVAMTKKHLDALGIKYTAKRRRTIIETL